jgi:hypothetical protein
MLRIVLPFILSMFLATSAQAQDAEIKDTINRQFDAFRVDDFGTAFEFASPNLQRLFQTPENFGRMVTQGYPMVWRPGEVRFLELDAQGDTFWQKVMITDMNGRVHILAYRMLQTDAGWRINGVQILDSADPSV